MTTRLAIIGYGAITEEVIRVLRQHELLGSLAGVLVRPGRLEEARHTAGSGFAVFDRLQDLLGARPTIVAECAGHGAMREYATGVLQARVPLLCTSVGVLADRDFAIDLLRTGGADGLLIPSGAIAGIDGLLAARTAGLKQASYTSIKPPAAWIGTPAEKKVGPTRTVLFEGTARQAALAYPKNVNVGVTVALAGLGMDRTTVSLVSDPAASGPLGIIEASGDFGTFRFEILAYASPRNPKTSLLTAHSVVAAAYAGVSFTAASALRGAPAL
jgi:aspartate dehydrogenase